MPSSERIRQAGLRPLPDPSLFLGVVMRTLRALLILLAGGDVRPDRPGDGHRRGDSPAGRRSRQPPPGVSIASCSSSRAVCPTPSPELRPRLIADGSGLPVRIAGRAILEVGFRSTETNGGTPAPRRRAFALPDVMTVVRSGLFEGVTTYGIGVTRKGAFQVHKQPEMSRVVIDVHATFDTVKRRVYFFDANRFRRTASRSSCRVSGRCRRPTRRRVSWTVSSPGPCRRSGRTGSGCCGRTRRTSPT